jgi:hypothetical protein
LKSLIEKQDFNILIEIIELMMGLIVNCEEKENYISKILVLEEGTQEDLKKLIEKSL